MFENTDYISLSLTDESIRKKSLKRVRSGKIFHVFQIVIISCLLIACCASTSSSPAFIFLPAMESAVEVPEEPASTLSLRSSRYHFRALRRARKAAEAVQIFQLCVIKTYQ
jgi:hypothetical protein